MAREIEKWHDAEFERVRTKIGEHHDGGGLYLIVRENGAFWKFRYGRGGKGILALGPMHSVTLNAARKEAQKARTLLAQGIDPKTARDEIRATAKLAQAKRVTFTEAIDRFHSAQRPKWRSEKHANEWRQTLRVYAEPKLGGLPVGAIDTPLVLQILEPLWREKPVTASRVRQRIESVLDAAKVRGWRNGENPARWRGHLDHILPRVREVAPVKHHKALPFGGIASFMAQLRQHEGVIADCLEFIALTAVRTSEAREAIWNEVTGNIWTIPAERTKRNREHRVALSPNALKILARRRLQSPDGGRGNGFIFPGRDGAIGDTVVGQLMEELRPGYTVHGLRSSFSDWAGETTSFPTQWVEGALGHKVGSETEVAYRRGDFLQQRFKLMAAWAAFCDGETGEVIALDERRYG
jgi:integrase